MAQPALQRRHRGERIRTLLVVSLVLALFALFPAVAAAEDHPPLGTNDAPVPALDWGPCPAATPEEAEQLAEYRCTTVQVPLSYRRPHGETIELALGLLPAADPARRIGTLFWNPGGPGGPGRIPPPFSEALHERFDIVGFDPRGIGESTPLRCFETTGESILHFIWEFPITRRQDRFVRELTRRGTDACAQRGGPILAHMATGNVARDLDLLRQAVGDQQLTYLGFSYGTHIGTVYANLFPERVRALTLDAVIEPVEWTTGATPAEARIPVEYRAGSFRGTYRALLSFLDACEADVRCAFREEGRDLLDKYDTLLARLRREPLVVTHPDGSQTTVTYQAAVGMTLGALYSASNSPGLAASLQLLWAATQQRASGAVERLAQRLLPTPPRPPRLLQPPVEEPYFGAEWGPAVECTDSDNPSNPRVWWRWARRADREAPYFGSWWVYLSLPCATWPAEAPDRYTGPWDVPTANPVLLIGNSQGDPATSYEDAVATAELMADARLLTLETFGHAAFGASQCVRTAVERYLIDEQLPPGGAVCQPDFGPFDSLPPAAARKREQFEEALGHVPATAARD